MISTNARIKISCRLSVVLILFLVSGTRCNAQATHPNLEARTAVAVNDPFSGASFLTIEKSRSAFALVENGNPATILESNSDHAGVVRVAGLFQKDLSQVSGKNAELIVGESSSDNVVIVGTLGRSTLINKLIQEKKIDAAALKGKNEQFLILPVKQPMKGVANALVIVGSDKRGTIFGMFELSAEMGVSPWYWWADVPAKVRQNIFVKPGKHTLGEPKVKYRVIFINDEAPALRNWAQEKFGGFNHKFYEKVFELILRNKGNYLWPAM